MLTYKRQLWECDTYRLGFEKEQLQSKPFLKPLLRLLTPFLAGGGFRSPPPSGFSRAVAKRLEIGSRNFVTFKEHSLRTFCETIGPRPGHATRSGQLTLLQINSQPRHATVHVGSGSTRQTRSCPFYFRVSHIEKLSMKPISVKKDNFSFDDLLSQSVGLRSNPIKNFEGAWRELFNIF